MKPNSPISLRQSVSDQIQEMTDWSNDLARRLDEARHGQQALYIRAMMGWIDELVMQIVLRVPDWDLPARSLDRLTELVADAPQIEFEDVVVTSAHLAAMHTLLHHTLNQFLPSVPESDRLSVLREAQTRYVHATVFCYDYAPKPDAEVRAMVAQHAKSETDIALAEAYLTLRTQFNAFLG